MIPGGLGHPSSVTIRLASVQLALLPERTQIRKGQIGKKEQLLASHLKTQFRVLGTFLVSFWRGYGSASLAEVLNRQAQLDVPAACASQGVDRLRNRELSRQEFPFETRF